MSIKTKQRNIKRTVATTLLTLDKKRQSMVRIRFCIVPLTGKKLLAKIATKEQKPTIFCPFKRLIATGVTYLTLFLFLRNRTNQNKPSKNKPRIINTNIPAE